MIIYTHRWQPRPKWIQPGAGTCPACHNANNWVGYQIKHFMGVFWITIIPGGSAWLIMCDVCSTFLRFRRADFKYYEDSFNRGISVSLSIPERYDAKGNLVGELRGGGWFNDPWVHKLAELKKRTPPPPA